MTNALEGDLSSLLMQVGREMRRQRLASLGPHGITPQQSRALGVIARMPDHEEVRPSRIAESLGIAPRSATEVIDGLEQRGIVERVPSPTDRRATVIRMTPAGRQLRSRIDRERAKETSALAAKLSEDEQDQLRGLLAKLLAP